MTETAKPIFLLGEALGSNEVRLGRGFVGASGVELLRMLDEAGIITLTAEDQDYIFRFWRDGKPELIDAIWQMHPEVHRSHVFQEHPPGNRIEYFCGPKSEAIIGYPSLTGKAGGYCRAEFLHHLERLSDEIIDVDPNLIVCLGNAALWALCGTTGVTKLRGTTRYSTHCVDGFKLIPTYHPAAILRQYDNRHVTVMDLIKAKRESAYPEIRRPVREVWIEPTLADLEEFHARFIANSEEIAIDIETAGDIITCVGFAPSPAAAIVVPFFDSRRKDGSYWPSKADERAAWAFVRRVFTSPARKVFQNGLYDIAFTWRSAGISTRNAADDTMLLHHALQPEALKGLAFLGSVYTDEGAWKQDRKTSTLKKDE